MRPEKATYDPVTDVLRVEVYDDPAEPVRTLERAWGIEEYDRTHALVAFEVHGISKLPPPDPR